MSDLSLTGRAAMKYAKAGLSVLALDGKAPDVALMPHGVNDATTDSTTIRRWFKAKPDANVGIAAGPLVFLDVDAGRGGLDALESLRDVHDIPPTRLVRSGGGGVHLWFRRNGSVPPNSKDALGPGVEVRATKQYVVAPPSVHPETGRRYRFEESSPIAFAPSWLHTTPTRIDTAPELIDGYRSVAAPRLDELEDTTRVRRVLDTPDRFPSTSERDLVLAGAVRRVGGTPAEAAALVVRVRGDDKKARRPKYLSATVGKAWGDAEFTPSPVSQIRRFAGREDGWPDPIAADAFHGVVGRTVRAIAPHSEADDAALLVQLLVVVGNVIGRGPHFRVEADRHGGVLFAVLVGSTSKGRKGSSFGHIERLVLMADPTWHERYGPGLSSGEGLIYHVRNATTEGAGQPDAGAIDKRFTAYESEFASVLQHMRREGNTVSVVMRQAWDGKRLATLTKHTPLRADDAHVSVIAHITRDELSEKFAKVESANGFANRFLWVCVKRSKRLPYGGSLSDPELAPIAEALAKAFEWAGARERRIELADDARALWPNAYDRLTQDRPGQLGAVTSRAEAQVRRVALVYAVLDRSEVVTADHLRAALAVWEYCEASARHLFGTSAGTTKTDRILAALRDAGSEGLRRTEISRLFQNHAKKAELDQWLDSLQHHGLVRKQERRTRGRTEERWFAVEDGANLRNGESGESPSSTRSRS